MVPNALGAAAAPNALPAVLPNALVLPPEPNPKPLDAAGFAAVAPNAKLVDEGVDAPNAPKGEAVDPA